MSIEAFGGIYILKVIVIITYYLSNCVINIPQLATFYPFCVYVFLSLFSVFFFTRYAYSLLLLLNICVIVSSVYMLHGSCCGNTHSFGVKWSGNSWPPTHLFDGLRAPTVEHLNEQKIVNCLVNIHTLFCVVRQLCLEGTLELRRFAFKSQHIYVCILNCIIHNNIFC